MLIYFAGNEVLPWHSQNRLLKADDFCDESRGSVSFFYAFAAYYARGIFYAYKSCADFSSGDAARFNIYQTAIAGPSGDADNRRFAGASHPESD